MSFKKTGILVILIMSLEVAQCMAFVFKSDFTGPNSVSVLTLPEWTSINYTTPPAEPTIENNQVKFVMPQSGWVYSGILANAAFNPMTSKGFRFEYVINKMTDTSAFTTNNAISYLCLSNDSEWKDYPNSSLGEKLLLRVVWQKVDDTLQLFFCVVNKFTGDPTYDNGVTVYNTEVAGLNISGGANKLKIAIEIRNDIDSNDVRVGYQRYSSSYGVFSWSDWEYSQWFDPHDEDSSLGLNADPANHSAFGADWKTNWTDKTYFYTMQTSPPDHLTTLWIDDAVVLAIDEPSSCEELYQYYPYRAITGDINMDCELNALDLLVMANNWLNCNKPGDAGCVANW